MYEELLENRKSDNFDSFSPILPFKLPNSTNSGVEELILGVKSKISLFVYE